MPQLVPARPTEPQFHFSQQARNGITTMADVMELQLPLSPARVRGSASPGTGGDDVMDWGADGAGDQAPVDSCGAGAALEGEQPGGEEEEGDDVEFETDPKRLQARQKQIDFGKNTIGYERYVQAVPRDLRKRKGREHDPPTPDVTKRMSKKTWDGIVRAWRRHLHTFDSMDEAAALAAGEALKARLRAPAAPAPATAAGAAGDGAGRSSGHAGSGSTRPSRDGDVRDTDGVGDHDRAGSRRQQWRPGHKRSGSRADEQLGSRGGRGSRDAHPARKHHHDTHHHGTHHDTHHGRPSERRERQQHSSAGADRGGSGRTPGREREQPGRDSDGRRRGRDSTGDWEGFARGRQQQRTGASARCGDRGGGSRSRSPGDRRQRPQQQQQQQQQYERSYGAMFEHQRRARLAAREAAAGALAARGDARGRDSRGEQRPACSSGGGGERSGHTPQPASTSRPPAGGGGSGRDRQPASRRYSAQRKEGKSSGSEQPQQQREQGQQQQEEERRAPPAPAPRRSWADEVDAAHSGGSGGGAGGGGGSSSSQAVGLEEGEVGAAGGYRTQQRARAGAAAGQRPQQGRALTPAKRAGGEAAQQAHEHESPAKRASL